MADLSKQAIQAALACDWQSAIDLNLKLIEKEPENTQALNRLAYAYLQTEKPKKAKKVYNSILKLDPNNPLASKHLLRLKDKSVTNKKPPTNGQIYIEEPGTSRVVELVNLAHKDILKQITLGIKAQHKIGKKKIEIRSESGEYIGSLPDDVSFHMRKLSEKGNKYDVFIKEVEDSSVSVYIRETFRKFDSKKKAFNSLGSLIR